MHPVQIKLQTSTEIHLCTHICSEKKSHLNRAFSETLLRCFFVFWLDEEIYGSLLKEAKDSVENEKSREGVLSRPVTVKEEVPPEDDYIPTVSV